MSGSMDEMLTRVNRHYNLTEYPYTAGDPRVQDWPFMRTPDTVVIMTALYLLLVKYGPSYMQNKAPLNPTALMVVYNFFMVGLSLYMFIEFMTVGYLSKFSLLCQPINYADTPLGIREASVSWWYFFSKIIEFLDTTFFILRKKNGQISFLHVYHHSTMGLICWYIAKYIPGGETFYAGAFNTLVHVVMYAYYGLAAMGPQIQPYLWWKKYLTAFQMVQFLSVNTRCILALVVGPCAFPRWVNVFFFCYSSTLFCLFANFYRKAYLDARSRSKSGSGSPKVTTDSRLSSSIGLTGSKMAARQHAD